jgi:hypothetical protein
MAPRRAAATAREALFGRRHAVRVFAIRDGQHRHFELQALGG